MTDMSVREAAEKWRISVRRVQLLCESGRIPGVTRFGRSWRIPGDAKKPEDARYADRTPRKLHPAELEDLLTAASVPMPANNPDAIIASVGEKRVRLQYEGELAYLRGDFRCTLSCFDDTEGDDAARIRAGSVAIAAAISEGDYEAYSVIEAELNKHVGLGGTITAFVELSLANAAVSVFAPELVPEWLKQGDFDALPEEAKPDARYKRSKYFNCLGEYGFSLAIAETSLSFYSPAQGISVTNIYQRIACAAAAAALNRRAYAKRTLLETMDICIPHGFITPFAELLTGFGGLVEECLRESYPAVYDTVIAQWERTFKNWIAFHNRFTRENITSILTINEYHVAQLLAVNHTYAKIGKHFNMTYREVKDTAESIYRKLLLDKRKVSQLKNLIL